jgi:hypothetical protein
MKEYKVGVVDVPIDYDTGKQSLVRSKDGNFYVVSSVNLNQRREEVDGLEMYDTLLGISGDSETMIFLGLHPEKSELRDARGGGKYRSYTDNYLDLWCSRPSDHDEGIKAAIEGGFDGLEV